MGKKQEMGVKWRFPAGKANLPSSKGSLRCLQSRSEANWFLVHIVAAAAITGFLKATK